MDKKFLCPQASESLDSRAWLWRGTWQVYTRLLRPVRARVDFARPRHRIVCLEQNHRYENRLSAVLRSS